MVFWPKQDFPPYGNTGPFKPKPLPPAPPKTGNASQETPIPTPLPAQPVPPPSWHPAMPNQNVPPPPPPDPYAAKRARDQAAGDAIRAARAQHKGEEGRQQHGFLPPPPPTLPDRSQLMRQREALQRSTI